MTVIALILIAVGAVHLALLPYVQIRGAIPAITAAIADAEGRVRSTDDALKAAAAVMEGTARFRDAMAAAPEQLSAAIAGLVARGRASGGSQADPYKARIRSLSEAAKPGIASAEDVLVEEAIRRQIGRHVEALSLSLETALEPLRLLKSPPIEAEEAYRGGQAVGGEVVFLNHILQEAFAADPTFWTRLSGQGARFAAVSARAGDAARRIEAGLGTLSESLVAASAVWQSRQEEEQATIAALRAQEADLHGRLAEFSRRLGWIPVGLEDALRTYPIVAGALALIALGSLLNIVGFRQADGRASPTPRAGTSLPSSYRWSTPLLGAVPLVATIHAVFAALTDRNLFTAAPGDAGPPSIAGYTAAYTALIVTGIVLMSVVTWVAVSYAPKAARARR
ncbi:MAG: hypothetical protein ACRDGN_09825 [bacterium]